MGRRRERTVAAPSRRRTDRSSPSSALPACAGGGARAGEGGRGRQQRCPVRHRRRARQPGAPRRLQRPPRARQLLGVVVHPVPHRVPRAAVGAGRPPRRGVLGVVFNDSAPAAGSSSTTSTPPGPAWSIPSTRSPTPTGWPRSPASPSPCWSTRTGWCEPATSVPSRRSTRPTSSGSPTPSGR